MAFSFPWFFYVEGIVELFAFKGWLLPSDEDVLGAAYFPVQQFSVPYLRFFQIIVLLSATHVSSLSLLVSPLLCEFIERCIGLSISEEVSECIGPYLSLLVGGYLRLGFILWLSSEVGFTHSHSPWRLCFQGCLQLRRSRLL